MAFTRDVLVHYQIRFLKKKFLKKKRKLTANDFSYIHTSFQTFTDVKLNVGSVVSGSKE